MKRISFASGSELDEWRREADVKEGMENHWYLSPSGVSRNQESVQRTGLFLPVVPKAKPGIRIEPTSQPAPSSPF